MFASREDVSIAAAAAAVVIVSILMETATRIVIEPSTVMMSSGRLAELLYLTVVSMVISKSRWQSLIGS